MRKVITLLSVLTLAGCDMFEYHPYDGRISGETGINRKNISLIEESCAGKNEIRFIVMGDTQGWYDETEDFVQAVNKRSDIDFVIHGGDITDFGLTKEFIWIRDIMNDLKIPYVVLLGNHDLLANGEQIYRTIFGEENFAFLAGNVRFICLNTNALEYDYSRDIPDFNFIVKQLEAQTNSSEKTVVAMHAAPLSEQFNNNVSRVFQAYIKNCSNLQFCLNAHDHNIAQKDLFNDGIIYYTSANIEKRNYLLFTIKSDNSYTYEVVDF